jgi:predicted DsbA family dithiol-disulfide isomerase
MVCRGSPPRTRSLARTKGPPVVDEKTDTSGKGAVAELPVRPRILVFFDYACPFCYVDRPRFDKLAADHDAEIVLIPYELRPDIPLGGVSASETGLTHSDKVETYVLRAAEDEGMRMTLPDHVPNTHLAMTMAEVARDAGGEKHRGTHLAIFGAYFAEGLDIGKTDVLLDVARQVGLARDDVTAAWGEDRYADRLRGFRHVALSLDVGAVPAALVCNRLLIGSRPYKVLEGELQECLLDREKAEGSAAVIAAEDTKDDQPAE